MTTLPRCFVMQPFDDGGPFDKRYDEVIVPAIKAAGFEPYRVDRDPQVSVSIDGIEKGIRESDACLADISLDNPNVWYELGYSNAASKHLCLICKKDRERFPFDVQHRPIIRYEKESAGDFERLRKDITERLKAILATPRASQLKDAPVATSDSELSAHEISALGIIMRNRINSNSVSAYMIRQEMGGAGFNDLGASFAIEKLTRKALISSHEEQDRDGDEYVVYSLTREGLAWIMENEHRFLLRQEAPRQEPPERMESDPPF